MKKNNYFSIDFQDDKFIYLDQTKLPLKEEYIETDDYNRIAEAIEKLEVRGAPAIGITAAYALALSIKKNPAKSPQKGDMNKERDLIFSKACKRLFRTRPTAVNLFYAINEMKKVFDVNKESDNLYQVLLNKAKEIHEDDIEKCRRIGMNGLNLFKKKSNILTHCNTGKLATGGDGTAFNVIKTGFEKGLVNFVYADETRPLLQGSRLTAFELEKNGIPFAIQSDSTAAVLMQQKKIDFVITGADRIVLNGDTANKIGTYNLAVLCNFHNIPFYVAAPSTTIDRNIPTGDQIEVEIRNKLELIDINGHHIAPETYQAFTPAFDVTPAHLITGIVTEDQIYFFPYNFIK